MLRKGKRLITTSAVLLFLGVAHASAQMDVETRMAEIVAKASTQPLSRDDNAFLSMVARGPLAMRFVSQLQQIKQEQAALISRNYMEMREQRNAAATTQAQTNSQPIKDATQRRSENVKRLTEIRQKAQNQPLSEEEVKFVDEMAHDANGYDILVMDIRRNQGAYTSNIEHARQVKTEAEAREAYLSSAPESCKQAIQRKTAFWDFLHNNPGNKAFSLLTAGDRTEFCELKKKTWDLSEAERTQLVICYHDISVDQSVPAQTFAKEALSDARQMQLVIQPQITSALQVCQ